MTTTYKNITVSYNDIGQGDTVLLIHGFLENSTMWNALVDTLKYTNRVITVDLLGHGQTDCLGYIHTMEDNADMIHALITQLDIKNFTVIGHSLGGYVALAFAEKHPEFMNGLCLMNSTPFADSQLRYETRTRAIKAAKKNYESLVSMSISNLFYEKNRELFSEDIEALKTEALKTPLQGYIATQEGMKLRKDRTEILKQLTCKKLIIAGKNDPILSLEDLESLKPINLLNISILEGGHMSYIENEGDFLQEIVHFVEKI